MFELNANLIVIFFAFVGALSGYFGAWKSGAPLGPPLGRAAGNLVLSILYWMTLNALGLSWASFAGIGLGLAFGLGVLLMLLSFKFWRHRRGGWR